jgi:hypothetical protein
MKPTLKVFLMTVLSFLISTVATLDKFNIWFVVLVTVAFAGEYAAKNYWFPSNSPEGQVYWKDILSGLFLAVCASLNALGASLLLGTIFTAHILWITVIGAIAAYFTKTLPQGTKM